MKRRLAGTATAALAALAVFAVLTVAACQKADAPEQMATRIQAESDSAKTAIEAINVRYASFLNGNMPDSIASLFVENGMMLAPGAPGIAGRDSIRAAMTAMPLPTGSTIALNTVDVAANGPIAIERGTFSFAMPAQGRTPAVTTYGKYLVHWHQVNGQWMMAADIWNDDAPPPAGN